ncbi:MAG: hypothetical protein ABH863_00620 [Candidatus Micrarchaeota archaeon]
MIQFKTIAMMAIALQALCAALTPDDFAQRLDNFESLRNSFLLGGVASGGQQIVNLPSVHQITQEMKRLQAEAHTAKLNGDDATMIARADALSLKFDELQAQTPPQISLEELKTLTLSDFKPVPTEEQPIVRARPSIKAPSPTILVVTAIPTPSRGLIPTISPDQLRGRKNFLYALGDILWENKMLLGIFVVGMLILYALYNRQEEQSGMEYGGD